MNWLRRLLQREGPQIPPPLWEDCVQALPFLHDLAPEELARLKILCERLLDRKAFSGAAGFELSDEVAVMIAIQACLPVLNLSLDLYKDMAGIIVYPAAFLIPHKEMDEAGVMHEWLEPASGEAIDAGGAVVLSWEDAQDAHTPGYNVVIHEFAHKIDMADGGANGCPPFVPEFHAGLDGRRWKQVFVSAYEDFARRLDILERQLPADFDDTAPEHAALWDALAADLPLDPYGGTHPAEFFAVASEAFFVDPAPLCHAYPEVYALLQAYYRQDPLQRK
ncbi:MAG TPA: M90 family metallopeptidase [Noviherbaspirillum sp.]